MKPCDHGWRQRWWSIIESVIDEDSDTLRQSLGRKIDAEDEVNKAIVATCASGLPDLRTRRGQRYSPMLPISYVQGRGYNQTRRCLRDQ